MDPSTFSEANPSAFYLRQDEFEQLADASFVVQGAEGQVSLPVHSQLLSQHSSVLRGLFLSQRQASGGEPVRLEGPFARYTAQEVACFLWCVYNPAAVPEDLSTLAGQLPALLRLAHQLEVPWLQDRVLRHVERSLDSASEEEVLHWLSLFEELHLADHWAAYILKLAQQLAAQPAGPWGEHRAYLLHKRLTPAALGALLGCTVAARNGAEFLPTAEAVAGWLEGVPLPPLTFTWRVNGFSTLPANVCSDPFLALGCSWRLLLYPRGNNNRGRYLSVYLQAVDTGSVPAQLVSTRFSIKLLKRTRVSEGAAHMNEGVLFDSDGVYGFNDFIRLSSLATGGFLVDDSITLVVEFYEPTAEVEEEDMSEEDSSEEEEGGM